MRRERKEAAVCSCFLSFVSLASMYEIVQHLQSAKRGVSMLVLLVVSFFGLGARKNVKMYTERKKI